MISGITLNKLRNTEFAQFASDVLEIIRRNDPATLQVQQAYDALLAENEQLGNLLKPIKGSALTAQLEAADTRRDEAVSGINTVVSGYSHHYDEATRTHAAALLRHLTVYGGAALARENYQSETASITSLLKDWTAKPELAAALTALDLTGWKDELQQANEAFSVLYLGRTEETGASSPDTVRGKRQTLGQAWYALRDLVNAYHVIHKGAAPYSTAVNQLNALIDKYNTLIATRKGSSSGETVASPSVNGSPDVVTV